MKKIILFIVGSLFMASCANKVSPTGGEKDIKPPVVKETDPINAAIDFHEKIIKLKFDEFVQLTDLNGQLLISPLMPFAPEIKAAKKEILIKLPDSLRENTTYTINFGKAIADINEGNALENYRFIFSTGLIIDTLMLHGTVREAKSNQVLKGLSVLMYRKEGLMSPDSLIFTKRPEYFSKTDEKGAYTISNIAEGKYFVFVVDDKNSNYKCDEEEQMGFIESEIKIPGQSVVDFNVSPQEFPVLKILKVSKKDKYYAAIGLNKPNTVALVEELNYATKRKSLVEWSVNRDTLMVYAKDTLQDSIKLRFYDDKMLNDTVEIKLGSGITKKKEQEKLSLFVYQIPQSSDTTLSLMFKSEHPIKVCNKYAYIYHDTILEDSVIIKLKPGDIQRECNVNYNWRRGEKYRVMILPGAITDIYGLMNDTLNKSFGMANDRLSGVLIVKMKGLKAEKNYLLQLTSEKLDVMKQLEVRNDGEVKFEFLNPDAYKIRLVEDDDNNKKWTLGDFRSKKQPERVVVSDRLQVRANWELETEITIE